MIKICQQCGKEFKVRGKKRKITGKFCSKKCQGLGFRGNIPWNKDKKGIHLSPKSEFKKGNIGYWLGKKRSPEDIEKFKKSHLGQKGYWTGKHRLDIAGEKCHTWKDGITPENHKIRNSLEYKLWRKAVFTRDDFICQKCQQKGGYLIAHHINNFAEFPELRFAIDNGITLCKKCHQDFHNKYGRKNNTKEQLEEFLII